MKKQRLSKVLAAAGIDSRRACEQLIFDGRVKVNGQIALLPQTMVSLEKDKLLVDGEPVKQADTKVYYLLNKPAGYLCSATRPSPTSKLVPDLFYNQEQRLMTIGRLETEATGLVIVTNDGSFVQRAAHPMACSSKEYVIKSREEISLEHLCALSHGTIIDGAFVKPVAVKKVRRGTLKLIIIESKKRVVSTLVESVGLTLIEIKRVRIGNIHLGHLPIGAWRPMTPQEVESACQHGG